MNDKATVNTSHRSRLHPSMRQNFGGFASPRLEQAEYERDCLGGRCFPKPGDTAMLERCREAYRLMHWLELFRRFHTSRYAAQHATESRLKYFAPLLEVRPKDLTRQVVIQWFHGIGEHSHTQANHALSLLRTMFTKAEEWGLWTGENPATRIKWFPRHSRSRFVQPEEMPALLESLALEPIQVQALFLLCLLCGCRGGEARVMRWIDINLTQGVWSKPTTKTGKPHVVPIPPALVQMLRSIPQEGDWVFASPRTRETHVKKVTSYVWWQRIRQRAGLNDITIHDLRRSCASWLAIKGENLAVIARVLNHTTLANTAIYARLNLAPVQSALFQHADNLLGMGVSGRQQSASAVNEPTPTEAKLQNATEFETQEWPG